MGYPFRNTLSFQDIEKELPSPHGMIVSGEAIAVLAERLALRAKHYSSLRVTSYGNQLIFWSIEQKVSLPWVDAPVTYLAQIEKSIFFPIQRELDISRKLIDPIVGKIVEEKNISRPVLLIPSENEEVIAVGLGNNSSPVPNVDWGSLRGETE